MSIPGGLEAHEIDPRLSVKDSDSDEEQQRKAKKKDVFRNLPTIPGNEAKLSLITDGEESKRSSSTDSAPPLDDLDYYAQPENYEGVHLVNFQKFQLQKDKKEAKILLEMPKPDTERELTAEEIVAEEEYQKRLKQETNPLWQRYKYLLEDCGVPEVSDIFRYSSGEFLIRKEEEEDEESALEEGKKDEGGKRQMLARTKQKSFCILHKAKAKPAEEAAPAFGKVGFSEVVTIEHMGPARERGSSLLQKKMRFSMPKPDMRSPGVRERRRERMQNLAEKIQDAIAQEEKLYQQRGLMDLLQYDRTNYKKLLQSIATGERKIFIPDSRSASIHGIAESPESPSAGDLVKGKKTRGSSAGGENARGTRTLSRSSTVSSTDAYRLRASKPLEQPNVEVSASQEPLAGFSRKTITPSSRVPGTKTARRQQHRQPLQRTSSVRFTKSSFFAPA